jgi:hypothetical protein
MEKGQRAGKLPLESKMTTMKQFRWFWAWDDEKEEAWLSEMAQKGWHFQIASLPGFYTFEHGEPRDDIYRLDYFPDSKDKVNYLQLFMDAGWDYKGEMNGWQYFRKPIIQGEVPEIFSDNESKSRKYRRIMLVLVVLLPIFIFNTTHIFSQRNPLSFSASVVSLGFLLFFIYAVTKLLQRVNQLKKIV